MKTQESLRGTRILSLIGQQGTGKTVLAKTIAAQLNGQYIEASDVVRDLCGDLSRSEMPNTNHKTKIDPDWLGRAIGARINCTEVMLSGVREQEVHDYLKDQGAEIRVVSLWAPDQERYARIKKRDGATYTEFIKHDTAELEIGLEELLEAHPPRWATSYEGVEATAVYILNHVHTILV